MRMWNLVDAAADGDENDDVVVASFLSKTSARRAYAIVKNVETEGEEMNIGENWETQIKNNLHSSSLPNMIIVI